MTAKRTTTRRRTRNTPTRQFAQRLLRGWLWIAVPLLVVNGLVDLPGLNDDAVAIASGLASLGLVLVTAGLGRSTVTRARKPRTVRSAR